MTKPRTEEEALLLDHEYDGIRELDNQLPGWWLWLFYLTILFSIVYLVWYHVLDRGLSTQDQYELEVARAHAAGLGIHYESWGEDVELQTDASSLERGREVFINQCAVCHGQLGEGLIGPNFTDDYFLHGAGFVDSIRTIEEGVPEKGMISWKSQLSREDVRSVASFIYTLRGSNPPNPKAPQGERVVALDG
ncbi:MAG: c-type cytochrome [Thermoanaerobaculia bacterium]|nr:c-type cytochrome [Thermoanaerobaculia bacterium]